MLRPDFERFYPTKAITAEGDLIRGIDVLGNAGFVRNVVEKARDHRNDRLDDHELDDAAGQRPDSRSPPSSCIGCRNSPARTWPRVCAPRWPRRRRSSRAGLTGPVTGPLGSAAHKVRIRLHSKIFHNPRHRHIGHGCPPRLGQ